VTPRVSENDEELLRLAFKDVTPLKGRSIGQKKDQKNKKKDAEALHAPRKSPAKPQPLVLPAAKPQPIKRALPELTAGAAIDVDRRTVQKLKRGKLPVTARLDLHGHTQDEAYSALGHFLAAMQGASARAVLVITGKSGVLRRQVPLWLNAPVNRARILSFAQARISDGGEGALYVLLRKVTK
jgi:DNA-nicking Smr family endonuclease